jgi:LPS-assembly lipoprotein
MTAEHGARLAPFALLLFLCLVFAGCGFRPLYGDHALSASDEDFASIYVAPISDRTGQQLRNFLLERINAGGQPGRPLYTLNIALAVQTTGIAISRDNTTSRTNITLVANYSLADAATGRVFSKGISRASDAYDVLVSDYATLSAHDDAITRASRELADDLKTRLAVFLQNRKQKTAGG